jgi:hypothetical protein
MLTPSCGTSHPSQLSSALSNSVAIQVAIAGAPISAPLGAPTTAPTAVTTGVPTGVLVGSVLLRHQIGGDSARRHHRVAASTLQNYYCHFTRSP